MNLADLIRSDDVAATDKTRLLECLKKVRMYYEMHDSEPIWGNCDIGGKIYKVHVDSSVTFIQSFDPGSYTKYGVKGLWTPKLAGTFVDTQ